VEDSRTDPGAADVTMKAEERMINPDQQLEKKNGSGAFSDPLTQKRPPISFSGPLVTLGP
jgi:hypothetical protein